MKKEEKIKIIELNNKSRKGKYIYVRTKGHTRYYKYPTDGNVKGILKHYKKELERIQKNKTQAGRKLKTQTTTKKRPIEKAIGKGRPTGTIDPKANRQQIQQMKEKLLGGIIKNKKDLKTITNENNLEKIKQRFEYTVTITGENGETLSTITKTGITPEKAINEIKNNLHTGDTLDESPGMMKMNELDWQGKLQTPGTIKKVTIQITFRKEK